ncbi:hypothetical protein FCOIX_9061 [Fusarium coicis]|nr:hypothetical protein FCOIX_9061 [Fusarium coicis]
MPAADGHKLNCASKTALAKAYPEMRSNGTIILLYTLAPPLFEHIRGVDYDLEQMTLPEYGEKGPRFRNWINGVNTLAGSTSDKKAVVLSFSLGTQDNFRDWAPYLYLSVATGGELYRTNYTSVSRLTICLLLAWMQADGDIDIPQAFKTTYKFDPTLFHWACEANMEVFCGLNRGNLEVFDTHTTPRNRLRVPYGDASNNNQQLNRFTSENLAKTYIDTPMMQYVEFYSPKHKQTPPATWNLWLHMSNNERGTTWALAYITDVAPALMIGGYWLTDSDAPVPKDRFAFDKTFWMPMVSTSLSVKNALPKEGGEWLRIRISAKVIKNGRYDAEAIVFHGDGDVVALGTHVALVLDGERNWGRKEKV